MKFAALIIENRALPNLVETIRDNHMKFLPEGTDLILYGSPTNEQELKFNFPFATYVNLGNIPMHMTAYNHFITQPIFWSALMKYDRILIFQHDSRILRTGIEEFYQWDYIGSPWNFQNHGFNGGISLRNPKVMFDICTRFKYTGPENEDVYFSNTMHKFPALYKLAPREEGTKFGVEAVFALGTFCLHAPWKWLKMDQVKQILRQYGNN